jgi:hypothetical protein
MDGQLIISKFANPGYSIFNGIEGVGRLHVIGEG